MRCRALALGALLLLPACPTTPIPGDQNLGEYGLHAEPVARDCQLKEVADAGFDFTATVSRQSDGGAAWLTLDGYSRDAGWDGQVVTSTEIADRVFEACPCGLRLKETVRLALLSQSQAAAVGLVCPAHPLDGGLPSPTADGGVALPAMTPLGFDAVLACGELETALELAPDGGSCPAGCLPCGTRFSLTGARR